MFFNYKNPGSQVVRGHTKFDCYIPIRNEDIRQRAVTYTSKDRKRICAIQKSSPCFNRDNCWALVNDVDFLNFCKAPHNPLAVRTLIDWIPSPKAIATGDVNSVHWAWQPIAVSSYGEGEERKM